MTKPQVFIPHVSPIHIEREMYIVSPLTPARDDLYWQQEFDTNLRCAVRRGEIANRREQWREREASISMLLRRQAS